tara:strand:- start:21384 stop:22214 length:831 start_codon:yes stop_codon:yes gene_type:complete
MKIVIDNRVRDFPKIANCLSACKVPFKVWSPQQLSELDMIDKVAPDVLFYSPEADSHSISHGARGRNMALVYVGEFPEEGAVNPSIILGSSFSKEVPLIPLPNYVADIFGSHEGTFSEEMACDVCCFTESLHGLTQQVSSSLVKTLIGFNARFFGSIPLNIKNYLGPVGPQVRSNICASSVFCVDASGSTWGEIMFSGGVPVVFTEDNIKAITFSNISELKKILGKRREDQERPNSITKSVALVGKNYASPLSEIFNAIGLSNHAANIQKEKGRRL